MNITTTAGAINTLSINNDDFLLSNKKTTTDYRADLAQAVGTSGTVPKIVQMAFGNDGDVDDQGNPVPPSDNGPINNVVLTKDVKTVTYPVAPLFVLRQKF